MEMNPAELAAVVAGSFAAGRGGLLPADAIRDLAHRIETALRTAARGERLACVDICSARATLWTGTAGKDSTPASLRAEARARANEVEVLADALRAR